MIPVRYRMILLAALVVIGAGLFYFGESPSVPSSIVAPKAAPDQPAVSPVIAPAPAAKSSPAPTPPRAGKGLEADVLVAARQEFKAFADEVLQKMPKVEDLRRLPPKELHTTPLPVREAGVRLGQVAELLERSPGLKPEGLDFYQRCSLQQEAPTPIRALCLNRALRLYAELHKGVWDFDRALIPEKVLELSKRL